MQEPIDNSLLEVVDLNEQDLSNYTPYEYKCDEQDLIIDARTGCMTAFNPRDKR